MIPLVGCSGKKGKIIGTEVRRVIPGVWKREVTEKVREGTFWGDENILYLGCGGRYMPV